MRCGHAEPKRLSKKRPCFSQRDGNERGTDFPFHQPWIRMLVLEKVTLAIFHSFDRFVTNLSVKKDDLTRDSTPGLLVASGNE